VTLHQNVLTALEHQALRYQNSKSYKELEDERLLDDAINETGTVPRSNAGDDEEIRVNVEEQLKKEIREVSDYLLEVHGVPPGGMERGSHGSSMKISMGCNQTYQVRMRS
jgi:hypothetical protein